jgi:hypothetical protein
MNKLAVLAYVSALMNISADTFMSDSVFPPQRHCVKGVTGSPGKFKKRKKVGNFFTPKTLKKG